jgi:uncharacterized iron-regulated protein
MIRFSPLAYQVAALCLFILTACAPAGKQVMGDPQEPYPLATPPRIGQIVHLPTGIPVTPAQMLAVAGDARIVYVGETHDNPASHRLELQVLQALAERYPGHVALGMEMFVRSQQPALDRWVAGGLDEKAFLKESHWFDNWNMDFAYYRDLLNFARERHIPVIALNAEKSLVKAVRSKAPEQLSPAERAQLPQLDMTDPYERGLVTAIFGEHSHGAMSIDGFIRAQTVWNETMAESAARYLASPAGEDKHLLVIAGGDHVSNGFGIPRRVFRRLAASYTIIGGKEINIPPDKRDRMMNVDIPDFPMTPYDFQVYQAYENLPETGVRLGVMIEAAPAGRGLVVKGVLPGSNAERAGLQQGDLLLSLDGESLTENFDLTYAVQRKHPGDRGVVQVERQGKTLKLEFVFLAAQKDHQHGKK